MCYASVTYVALSTLANDKDVELMGRVLAQDLKQAAHRRLCKLATGEQLFPVLTIFDEFAALNEADQLADLLLQARQALMPTVISTQYLPVTTSLRKACLGATMWDSMLNSGIYSRMSRGAKKRHWGRYLRYFTLAIRPTGSHRYQA